MDNRAIAVFDSGLGGLTAVKRIADLMPNESIIYFGDTGRVPYGTRSEATIIKYVKQDINFLSAFNVKAVLAACGTASTVALPKIELDNDVTVMGVFKPACSAAVKATKNGRIAVIGTAGTIKSGAYEKEILSLLPSAKVISKACPLFVPIVENGHTSKDDIIAKTLVEEYMSEIKQFGADTVILGCTHYPLLKEAIADFMGDAVLIDSGAQAAVAMGEFLKERDMLSDRENNGELKLYVSDYSAGVFESLASAFLEMELENTIETIDIEKF